jgi:hypothetical protein
MMRASMRAAAFALLVLVAACSRSDPAAKHRLFARDEPPPSAAAPDPAHPEAALALTADEVAARLGSFDWTGAVDWSVTKDGQTSLHVVEQHRVRQAATGEFEVRADVDPGLGPQAVQGKQIIYVNGMTYARAQPAPFRERPTDHGRDARRFREDSFGLARSVAGLLGPALRFTASGDGVVLGRQAHTYKASLDAAAPPAPRAPPAGYQEKDPDTAARQGFLRGAVPSAADGELSIDAQTGAPLSVRLQATFSAPAGQEAGPPVSVVVSAQVKALGGEVKVVGPPQAWLPDERKPSGPSTALEAAGLKKKGDEGSAAEPGDEPE